MRLSAQRWIRTSLPPRSPPPAGRPFASLARPKPWLPFFRKISPTQLEETLERETGVRVSAANNAASILDRVTGIKARQLREESRAQQDSIAVRCVTPKGKEHYVEQFNKCLRTAARSHTNAAARNRLWGWYIRSQLVIPGFVKAIPASAWDILWRTQEQRPRSDRTRAAHLKRLTDDMKGAHQHVTLGRRCVEIESDFLMGNRAAAIQAWEEGFSTQEGRTEEGYSPEFLELGVRMYSITGQVETAQKLLIELFALYPEWDPRVVLPVFEAHIQAGQPLNIRCAWGLYTYMKEHLCDKIALEDYEKCYLGFLHRRCRKEALAVFRDMMLSPELRGPDGYKPNARILTGFNDLEKVMSSASEVNETMLTGLMALPRMHQNKFFFGKWIKRLIGLGELDAAAEVFELMIERGVQPAPRYLNGLMGAWLRSGDVANIQKAETLGLRMVVERISLVARRAHVKEEPLHPTLEESLSPRRMRLFQHRTLPAATSETFGVLLEIYLKQKDWAKVEDLREWQVTRARLSLNTPALNAWMRTHLECRELGAMYQVFKRETGRRPEQQLEPTLPDETTIALLWDAARAVIRTRNGTPAAQRNAFFLPATSTLLRHTLSQLARLRAKDPRGHATAVSRIASSSIPNRVVAAFCAHGNLTGALVALHAIHRDIYCAAAPSPSSPRQLPPWPTPTATTHVAKAIARAAASRSSRRTPRRRRELELSPAFLDQVGRVLAVLKTLLERREARARGDGGRRHDADDAGDGRLLLLNALSELIRIALLTNRSNSRSSHVTAAAPGSDRDPALAVEAAIKSAKSRIRLPDLETGDVNAWEAGRV